MLVLLLVDHCDRHLGIVVIWRNVSTESGDLCDGFMKFVGIHDRPAFTAH